MSVYSESGLYINNFLTLRKVVAINLPGHTGAAPSSTGCSSLLGSLGGNRAGFLVGLLPHTSFPLTVAVGTSGEVFQIRN